MYRNNILNIQESTTILNAYTKKSGKLLKALSMSSLTELFVLFPEFKSFATDNISYRQAIFEDSPTFQSDWEDLVSL